MGPAPMMRGPANGSSAGSAGLAATIGIGAIGLYLCSAALKRRLRMG